MPSYKAPVKDMQFLLDEVFFFSDYMKELPYFSEVDGDMVEPILDEAAKICENEIAPLNQSGDAEGVHFNDGKVTTPKGFKEAYKHFVEGGWMSLNADPEFGGQGLPKVLQVCLDEMLCSSNVSFSLYTVLTQGTVHALHAHASDELKQIYLPKLVSGEWGGTMCLTESHCGTDLGLLRTKAEPQGEGKYKISGTKIFITSGEHDLTNNIIHTVLARLPDAPPGIKGISLFLVPKVLVNDDGSLGAHNGVSCGSIEHKMGIKASATCVMNFDGAEGYLIGEPNKGMLAMFSMMNLERLNIGLEGLGLGEVSYQNAVAYAKDRLQSRAPTGARNPEGPADPILVHPDVRRMLLTMKAYNEGARAFALWAGKQVDISFHSPEEAIRKCAGGLVALTTPIIKAFFTDYGFEACNLGLQVLGGHGYIKEWGMEQFVRDARIAQIYEGANGVQALDLTKRKLIMNKGRNLSQLSEIISKFITHHKSNTAMHEFIEPLEEKLADMVDTSEWLINNSEDNPDLPGAASVDYLKQVALIILAFMWAKMAAASLEKEEVFYKTKLKTARFFYQKLLPEVDALKQNIKAGSESLMAFDDSEF